MTVTGKMRVRVYGRDGGRCVAAGAGCSSGLTVHHRQNRGMGGSKQLDTYPNLLTLCGVCNARLEADADFAARGRARGWKLPRNAVTNPAEVPVWYSWAAQWRLLDNTGEWVPVNIRRGYVV